MHVKHAWSSRHRVEDSAAQVQVFRLHTLGFNLEARACWAALASLLVRSASGALVATRNPEALYTLDLVSAKFRTQLLKKCTATRSETAARITSCHLFMLQTRSSWKLCLLGFWVSRSGFRAWGVGF